MAIATALRGFNDLEYWVTPTFLSRNRFYLQRSTHCPRMNKTRAWEVNKKSRFLSMGHRILLSCDCARCLKLWSLNLNLFFKELHQLTKFTY